MCAASRGFQGALSLFTYRWPISSSRVVSPKQILSSPTPVPGKGPHLEMGTVHVWQARMRALGGFSSHVTGVLRGRGDTGDTRGRWLWGQGGKDCRVQPQTRGRQGLLATLDARKARGFPYRLQGGRSPAGTLVMGLWPAELRPRPAVSAPGVWALVGRPGTGAPANAVCYLTHTPSSLCPFLN